MPDQGREIEALAEISLTSLARNSELVSEQYEAFLKSIQARVDQVKLLENQSNTY